MSSTESLATSQNSRACSRRSGSRRTTVPSSVNIGSSASAHYRCFGRATSRHKLCSLMKAAVPHIRQIARLAAILVLVACGYDSDLHAQPRPRVGLALGGGSARGLAHVGVLRWLEEHRIPVDLIAGTSMGGLIGGSYATGLSPDDLEALLSQINWDSMFGSNDFQYLSVRRKRDARSYPSYLEFGLRGGLVAPPSLNSGQQVEFLLARITAPYYSITAFDDLPTPFRCVAVDLRTARPFILENGSLAQAMRSTMSIPLVFPP